MNNALMRPAFTRELAERLIRGESLNLTAPHGLGRRQTVQDLRSILPPEMRVLYADMKFSLHDFPATLRELCAQAGVYDAEVPNVGKLIMALAKKSQPTLLILHNLDLLRDSPHDPLFDTELLPHLVAFAGHAHLSLLTVSEDIYPDWALPCKHIAIPLLEKNGDT